MGRGLTAWRPSKIRAHLLLHPHLLSQVLPRVEIGGKNKQFRVTAPDPSRPFPDFVALGKLFSLSFLIHVMGVLTITLRGDYNRLL